MDYLEWSKEYERDALRIKKVIERKYNEQKSNDLTADERKRLGDDIREYRHIYRELMDIAVTLRARSEVSGLEA